MKAKALFIAALFLIFVLFSSIAYSQYYVDYTDGDTSDSYYVGENFTVPDWYEISDEEIEFCRTYGGQEFTQNLYTASEESYPQPVSKLTIALQGEYTTLYETTFYEIAWYVHPLQEDVTYSIYLVEDDGDIEEFMTGYATALDGSAGYEAVESDVIYTEAFILMKNGSEALRVPIVEKLLY